MAALPTFEKKRVPALRIQQEINHQLMILEGGKHKCCACRAGPPRPTTAKERSMHGANWIVSAVQPFVAGCDKETLTAIVWVMRRYDCSDWD